MKYEEFLKLKNSRAHLTTIRQNIVSTNKELENILILKKESSEDVLRLLKEAEKTRKETNKIIKEKESLLERVENKILRQKEAEANLLELKVKTKKECDAAKKEAEKWVQEKSNKLSSLQNQISETEELLFDVLNNAKGQNELLAYNKKVLQDIKKDLVSERRNYQDLVLEKNSVLYDLDNKIKSAIKELDNLKNAISREKYRFVEADKYVAKKDKEYAQRERDIQTVIRRLKELFREVKPGIALKI